MLSSAKTFVYTTQRHYRLMFFVDSKTPIEKIINLFHTNIKVWGGRYNPIIPVYNNNFDSYKELIKKYDPDFIYYSSNIDVNVIKELNYFNPKQYILLNENTNYYNFTEGVNCHYLLNDKVRESFFYGQQISLLSIDAWSIEIPAKSFYQTNFGLSNLYIDEVPLIKGYNDIRIREDNRKEVNKLISEKRPIFKSILSQLYVDTNICEPKEFGVNNNFEFIIYDPQNSLEDLTYFWNRQLYIASSKRLNQIIASIEDFRILIKDDFFGKVLQDLSINSGIDIVSKSIERDALELLRQEIQSNFKSIRFALMNERSFPFEILRTHNRDEFYSISKLKHVIIGHSDLLKLPALNFNNRLDVHGNFVIDIEFEKDISSHLKNIKFPFRTPLHHLVCQQEGRVNDSNCVSLFVSNKIKSIDIKVPYTYEIFRTVLSHREEDGKYIQTGLDDLQLSSDGQKLSAFLKLFDNDWDIVSQFIGDKFWLQLFRYKSEIQVMKESVEKESDSDKNSSNDVSEAENTDKNHNEIHGTIDDKFWFQLREGFEIKSKKEKEESSIPVGKGIFSYKDLKKERCLIYKKYLSKIREKGRITGISDDTFVKYIESEYRRDFELYIDSGLQFLVDKDALFIGLKVKCENCGSNSWYALNELQNKMPCKGCKNIIIPKIKSELYYRLNEIIISNLLSNKKEFHGNYVVLKALLYLSKKSSEGNFIYCPPMECTFSKNGKKISTDIDILAIQDGKFIIGEAKSDAKDFNSSAVKENIVWLGNNLKPDKIFLAFEHGRLNNVEEIARNIEVAITQCKCKVEAYKTSEPRYWFGALFGLPKEEK